MKYLTFGLIKQPQKQIIFTIQNKLIMKKIFLLATAAFLVTSASFAEVGKGKKKRAKAKTCVKGTTKSCCMDKSKTAKI